MYFYQILKKKITLNSLSENMKIYKKKAHIQKTLFMLEEITDDIFVFAKYI